MAASCFWLTGQRIWTILKYVFCGRIQVPNHAAAPHLIEPLYWKSHQWKTVEDHGRCKLTEARKEERDNYQTKMNIVDIACLSQSQPYRVGRFGWHSFILRNVLKDFLLLQVTRRFIHYCYCWFPRKMHLIKLAPTITWILRQTTNVSYLFHAQLNTLPIRPIIIQKCCYDY